MSKSKEETTTYSLKEVEEHKTLKSLWLVIHNKVYDITEFVDEHPGGEEVLLEQAGHIATEAFEDVGHSADARELMADYYIGDICKEDQVDGNIIPSEPQDTGSNSTLSWFIPVAFTIGIIAVAIYKMMAS